MQAGNADIPGKFGMRPATSEKRIDMTLCMNSYTFGKNIAVAAKAHALIEAPKKNGRAYHFGSLQSVVLGAYQGVFERTERAFWCAGQNSSDARTC